MMGLRVRAEVALKAMPIVWVATIALGTTIETIGLILALFSILLQPNLFQKTLTSIQKTWYGALLAIVIWGCLSLCWAPELGHEAWSNLRKIFRLLLLPLMIIAFKDEKYCFKAADAFLLSMCLPLILSILKFLQLINWRDADPALLPQ